MQQLRGFLESGRPCTLHFLTPQSQVSFTITHQAKRAYLVRCQTFFFVLVNLSVFLKPKNLLSPGVNCLLLVFSLVPFFLVRHPNEGY